ncbi:hypothetical protein GCM10009774_16100 [Cellulomonas gelida]|uniref:Uncharacterized protein n=2 Tax=Cellulomonas gelida TaxID=1712 RepID=A0A4Y3KL55_9CELL|nr:hypothetical protein CGE01nite_16570 [Cellulomonas gelida]GGL26434.1 hypothetical protein GCM10009774_16100 [Cellulomonas gelida]
MTIDWETHEDRCRSIHLSLKLQESAIQDVVASVERKLELWNEWQALLIELRAYAGAVMERDAEALGLVALVYGTDLVGDGSGA